MVFLGLCTFSNVNVIHKGLLLQDRVFRLGVKWRPEKFLFVFPLEPLWLDPLDIVLPRNLIRLFLVSISYVVSPLTFVKDVFRNGTLDFDCLFILRRQLRHPYSFQNCGTFSFDLYCFEKIENRAKVFLKWIELN